jgi:hypothetical protein
MSPGGKVYMHEPRILLVIASRVLIFTSLLGQGVAAPITGAFRAFSTTTQSAQDVKGWRGAEWGMTVEQARAASRLSIAEPAKVTNADDPTLKCYIDADLSIGEWKGEVQLCFGGQGQQGLVLVSLVLDTPNYERVRDDLKSKYGVPMSDSTDSLAGGTVEISRAKWLLPSTELTCTKLSTNGEGKTGVIYTRRKQTPF